MWVNVGEVMVGKGLGGSMTRDAGLEDGVMRASCVMFAGLMHLCLDFSDGLYGIHIYDF